ncbi:MAG: hypothetical protein ACLRZH_13345 [Ruthenibacterium lactatiformans]
MWENLSPSFAMKAERPAFVRRRHAKGFGGSTRADFVFHLGVNRPKIRMNFTRATRLHRAPARLLAAEATKRLCSSPPHPGGAGQRLRQKQAGG